MSILPRGIDSSRGYRHAMDELVEVYGSLPSHDQATGRDYVVLMILAN